MEDFNEEFEQKYGEDELKEVSKLIDQGFDKYSSCIITGDIWSLSLEVEKHGMLQHTLHMALSKEVNGKDDEEVNLEFEDGIDNGTVLRNHCLEGSSTMHSPKMVRVLVDLKYDFSLSNTKHSKELTESIFNDVKPDILEVYKKQNYDNYVTGGGSTKTSKHYRNELDKYHDRGFYWTCVYEEQEVDRNFI